MALPSESEIMANWQASEPLVSICCITFNHRAFIKDAIEGFLKQKTDFPFEIIIHDDASTDGTADIVRDYVAAYPTLIVPILQTQNQHSLGKKSTVNCFNLARGRYIALCEGDDYWCHEQKLALQVAALAKYPASQLCFHAALQQDYQTGEQFVVSEHSKTETVFDTKTMISGNGGFCPTASMLFERSVVSNLPAWFESAPVGDYFYQIFASLRGGAVFLPLCMSVYRSKTPGSWSEKVQQLSGRIEHYNGVHMALDALDADTQFHYTACFSKIKASDMLNLARLAISARQFDSARNLLEKSWVHYPRLSVEQQLFFYARNFQTALAWLYKLREFARAKLK